MNATVITTGPGVIMATATASRNCWSLSQWNWLTTPPCRNGTIASPLPKTNAPASAKYQAIVQSVLSDATPPSPESHQGGKGSTNAELQPSFGGALTRSASKPLPTNSQITSDSVHAVITALTANSAQSRRSLARVIFPSF